MEKDEEEDFSPGRLKISSSWDKRIGPLIHSHIFIETQRHKVSFVHDSFCPLAHVGVCCCRTVRCTPASRYISISCLDGFQCSMYS